MHGLECLDFQLMLATCLEVLRTSCYSFPLLPFIFNVKLHASAKVDVGLQDFVKPQYVHTYVRTYLLSMRIIELNARHSKI